MANKVESQILQDFDNQLIATMKKHGKKQKKYQLIAALKEEIACSELEVNLSLKRLLENGLIKTTNNNDYYILAEYK